jgi:RHS repeat-associated protein
MDEKSNAPTQTLSLPKGGGAIKGIGETFRPEMFTGTGNFSVPIYTSPGRSGFAPKLHLDYSTGSGNGPFGMGWLLFIPRVTRKTEKGLPRYNASDVFILSGAEDLVPAGQPSFRNGYTVTSFRPRTEGLFSRIECWEDANGDIHWRATTNDNVTSIYGKTAAARLADPANPRRIYEWLLQETFDTHGNHILYEYSREDQTMVPPAIYEVNRTYTQLYIRRIFYGNTNEQVGPRRAGTDHRYPSAEIARHYLFEVFFDYGDLEGEPDASDVTGPITDDWLLRDDRFSNYRAGFEIRTLRRCRRVMMYHHATELGGAIRVKSTDFGYDTNPDTLISFLTSVTLTGYRRVNAEYQAASLPPVTFRYSAFTPTEQHYQSVCAKGDALPPFPLSDPDATLIDLFGKGLPDLLHTTPTGYRYWKNVGGAFDRPQTMGHAPAGIVLSEGNANFADLAGDGHADLLVLNGSLRGFYETTPDGDWFPLRRIQSFPTLDLNDHNVRLLDLTGDGLTDILVARERHFLWYECLGEEGYAPPQLIPRVYDLNEFPDVAFDDPTGRVRLADMNGDGLLDIVLLHNGRVDYWPNLGYGRFGKQLTMADAPRLERDFDPARLFLADLDGSGCADLVYVESGIIRFWFNRSGNSWSDEHIIHGTPDASSQAAVRFADFYGMGTTAIIWSYPLNRQPDGNYKVLDFCGGVKPYLLVEMDNHMGATTRAEYASSTRFFLEDEKAGKPWITRMSFPVQVVAKVEVIDQVSRTKLVTTYKYYHGYFDGHEREFRGFGRVDRFDTEYVNEFGAPGLHDDTVQFDNAAPSYHLPPVETRTWFHTGIYFDPTALGEVFDFNDLDHAYRQSYYAGDQQFIALDSHDVETGITPREAYRALRGAPLRTEVYAHDGTTKADHPYQVTENRYRVRLLQPKGNNAHAVYHTTPLETLTYHYERQPADPRVLHVLNLRVDNFGNITDSITIAYGRRDAPANLSEQAEPKILYTHDDFINAADTQDYYYVGLLYQTRLYEISGLLRQRYHLADCVPLLKDPNDFVPYHRSPAPGILQKRIVEWTRTYFRKDTEPYVIDPPQQADHRLGPGEIERLGLPYETYKAALTDDLITNIYGTDSGGDRVIPQMLSEGGYVAQPGVLQTWWVPSGRASYDEDSYYLSNRFQDAFGNISQTTYDPYDLLVEQVVDPLGNTIRAVNDYRTLQPEMITDPNGNHTQVAFDILGMVVGTAIMGKAPGAAVECDSLRAFEADLSQAQVDGFFEAADPHIAATALLKDATTRIVYDLDCFWRSQQAHPDDPSAWLPVYAATLARETHASDPLPPQGLKIQISFSYSDGFGREIQKKIQAEPGSVVAGGPQVQPRWVASGWTIFNNKGKPVRQYEPFFSTNHHFQFGTKVGVSPVLFYDPVERVVATLHPNHTYEKVVFDPWQQTTYDVNDTATFDPKVDPDVSDFFRRLPDDNYLPTWYERRKDGALGGDEQRAATSTALHANTPTTAYFDTLGRTVLTDANNGKDANGNDQLYTTKVVLDVEGNQVEVIDARGRIVIRYGYDMLGNRIHQDSMDAGASWMLNDVIGKQIRAWDSRGHKFTTTYDALRRPLTQIVRGTTAASDQRTFDRDVAVDKIEYGEPPVNASQAEKDKALSLNLRTRVLRHFDSAGVSINAQLDDNGNPVKAYDFKGNLLHSTRQLVNNYIDLPDWSQNTPYETFESSTRYDALNRPTEITSPDQSAYHPTYNEANLLDKVDINLRGDLTPKPFVTNIDYNAKGQRTKIEYNEASHPIITAYSYEADTFRLTRLVTTRPLHPEQDKRTLQDLAYTYDPVGNITHIFDRAQPRVFFDNECIEASNDYQYDAIYRLTAASGREHRGQDHQSDWDDTPRMGNPIPYNCQEMRNYVETYRYDEVGNILQMIHQIGSNVHSPGTVKWNRRYQYRPDNNQLRCTSVPRDIRLPDYSTDMQQYGERYSYDDHGNMISMPHLTSMAWDFKDQLQTVNLGSGSAHYVYDASGQRLRKVIHRQNGTQQKECIYLGGFEIYREYNGGNGAKELERETLHVMDDKQRIALVETKTIDVDAPPNTLPEKLIRFQFSSHLGTACLETNDTTHVISYEEYHPYGSTSYQAVDKNIKAAAKRYRYTGKERDEESGLYYHGARYYAPWLGRWAACDPSGLKGGTNFYLYTLSNPISFSDQNGREPGSWRNNLSAAERFALWVDDVVGTANMQTAANYSAGLGDYLSFGLTDKIRNKLGTNSVVDKDSASYNYGQASGVVLQTAIGAAAVPTAVARYGAAGAIKGMVAGAVTLGAANKVADALDPSQTASATINTLASYALPFASRLKSPPPDIKLPDLKIPGMPTFEIAPGEVASISISSKPVIVLGAAVSSTAMAQAAPVATIVAAAAKGTGGGGPPKNQAQSTTLKGASTEILKANQDRSNQTILTARIKVNGKIMKVAMPNTPSNGVDPPWRDLQQEVATREGYEPLNPPEDTVPGNHAEENLGGYLRKVGGTVLEWAISRGEEGSSFICKTATCRVITSFWGQQQFK